MRHTKISASLVALAVLACVTVVSYRIGATSVSTSLPGAVTVKPAAVTARPVKETSPSSPLPAIMVPSFAPLATSDAEQKITALRDMLTRLPEQYIPEIVFVTDGEWHQAVDGKLESPEDFRRAMATLRGFAQQHFASALRPAIIDYRKEHEGGFITDSAQLQPYLATTASPDTLQRYRKIGLSDVDAAAACAITPAMLQRYALSPASMVPNVIMGGDTILTAPRIDSDYDAYIVIGPNGSGSTSAGGAEAARDHEILKPALHAYKAAKGPRQSDISEVLPYATTPEQRSTIEKLMRRQVGGL